MNNVYNNPDALLVIFCRNVIITFMEPDQGVAKVRIKGQVDGVDMATKQVNALRDSIHKTVIDSTKYGK